MKNNPLKPEYSRYGTFNQLMDENQEQLRILIEELSSQPQEAGSVSQKIATMYSLALDSVKSNELGYEPIKEQLNDIMHLASKAEVAKMIATMQRQGMAPYFAFFVSADDKNSSQNIAMLYQAGLGMGDKDYYLQNDDNMKSIRDAYHTYINHLFTAIGSSPEQAEAAVNSVMKIETGIAEASYSREDLRDSQKNYNKISVEELKKQNKAFDWDVYLEALGVADLKEIDVKQIDYYKALDKFLSNASLDDQKYYLAFNLMDAAAPYLSDNFVDANFEFYGKVMSGRQEQQPRWKKSYQFCKRNIGRSCR